MAGVLQRFLFPVLCIVQCASLALHNVYGLFPGDVPYLQQVLNTPPLRAYGQLTGSGISHGFFAPQVASMFILQLRRETPGDTVRWTGPELHSTGGKKRYVAFLNYCQYLRPRAGVPDSLRRRQMESIVRRLAEDVLPPQANHPTRCIVYAVRQVPLGTPADSAKYKLAIFYDTYIHMNTH